MSDLIMITSGFSGALSVILGAFAAHALKKRLEPDMLSAFRTGVDYQFIHTFALALVGLTLIIQGDTITPYLGWAAALFVIGTLFFSGSLYLLALTRKKIFGPITPIGGLLLILGWICYCLHWIK